MATDIEVVTGVTFDNTWSSLTIPATWTAVYFTVKSDQLTDADAESLIQILESNPSDPSDGLLYLNGTAGTAGNGSLSVDQGAGTVQVVLADDATASLGYSTGNAYDIKVLLSDGTSQLLESSGTADIVSTPTLTI